LPPSGQLQRHPRRPVNAGKPRPGTPIVSRRRARASDFRMPGAPFAWTKAGLELKIGFGDSSIWRRFFFAGKYRFFCSVLMAARLLESILFKSVQKILSPN
jgi:hypothetical protein